MPARYTTLCAILALACAARGAAQGPLVSLQMGVTPLEGEREFEAGVRVSPRGNFGVAFSLDLYPRYLVLGAFAGIADFSLAGSVPIGSAVKVELRAGASMFAFASTAGAGAATGFNAGAGLVVAIDSRTTLRADYTYRQILADGEGYPFPSLTVGFLVHR